MVYKDIFLRVKKMPGVREHLRMYFVNNGEFYISIAGPGGFHNGNKNLTSNLPVRGTGPARLRKLATRPQSQLAHIAHDCGTDELVTALNRARKARL